MKLNLQNKLLLPILTALLFFMGSSAFILSHFIVGRLEENIISMLHAGNSILAKSISNTTSNYKNTVRAMASTPILGYLAEFQDSNKSSSILTKEDTFAQTQYLLKNYRIVSLNLHN